MRSFIGNFPPQSYEEDFEQEDDEDEGNGSGTADSDSGKAVVMKVARSQWEGEGEGEGEDKGELTELMAALENENQLAREHSDAQVSNTEIPEIFAVKIFFSNLSNNE